MKRQIRRGVFETNSSSVHSITMCSGDEYKLWEQGKLYKHRYNNRGFKTREEIIEELRNKTHWKTGELIYTNIDWNHKEMVDEIIRENEYVTEEEFWNDIEDYETFHQSYTTENGDIVFAFGYYGENY